VPVSASHVFDGEVHFLQEAHDVQDEKLHDAIADRRGVSLANTTPLPRRMSQKCATVSIRVWSLSAWEPVPARMVRHAFSSIRRATCACMELVPTPDSDHTLIDTVAHFCDMRLGKA